MHIESLIDWSANKLLGSIEAQSYLSKRGVPLEIANRLNIGFIDSSYIPSQSDDRNHSDKCESAQNRCDTCRFLSWSQNDRLLGRVVLPLTSYSGASLGIQTRSIKEKTYDTFLLSHRPESYFFGLRDSIQKIWTRKYVVLVEGPFDCMILKRFVDHPVIAITTNATNENQSRFLNRYVDRVYTLLDNDKAGRDGFISIRNKTPSLEHIRLEISPRFDVKDVNDLWVKLGDERFSKEISSVFSHVM